MRTLVLIAIAFLFAVPAHAGSIPVYTPTQGTMTVGPGVVDIGSFSGFFSGNGFQYFPSGLVGNCDFCVAGVPGGLFSLDAGIQTFSQGQDSFQVGNLVYSSVFSGGNISISSKPFNLPTGDQSTFSITVPVTFSGQLALCTFDINNQVCTSGTFAIVSFNGKGTGTINFAQEGPGQWFFTSASFTMSSVPEPETFTLLGTGIVGLIGGLMRRRQGAQERNREWDFSCRLL